MGLISVWIVQLTNSSLLWNHKRGTTPTYNLPSTNTDGPRNRELKRNLYMKATHSASKSRKVLTVNTSIELQQLLQRRVRLPLLPTFWRAMMTSFKRLQSPIWSIEPTTCPKFRLNLSTILIMTSIQTLTTSTWLVGSWLCLRLSLLAHSQIWAQSMDSKVRI